MIVAFEGIDGAGKTSVAQGFWELGQRRGVDIKRLEKKALSFPEGAVQAQVCKLQEIIWSDNESRNDLFGTHFYLYALAAWASAVDRYVFKCISSKGVLAVADWSYFRTVAKAFLRSQLDRDWIESLFAHIDPPDLIFLLDIDPHLAWERRRAFKPSELGYWDGHAGEEKAAYCDYQTKLRLELLRQARSRSWNIIQQSPQRSVADTVAQAWRTCEDQIKRRTRRNA